MLKLRLEEPALKGTMKVRLNRLADYLEIELTGHVDLPQLIALIARLEAITREHGDRRALFDLLQLEGELNVAGQMRIGEQVARCMGHLESVASVVPTERMTRASENVARSQGARLKIFDSKDAAIGWLRQTETVDEDSLVMDPARTAIWLAVRHLFPPHAQAVQLRNGTLAISWAMARQEGAPNEMATPITVRLEPDLEECLQKAGPAERERIATHQEGEFRAGLMGYDPFTDVPRSRVIVLG